MNAGITTIGREALDDPATDPALVRRMLTDIAVANRWFGGRTAVTWGLRQLIDTSDRGTMLSLFDVGTGAGDLPRRATQWASRRGVTFRPAGLERTTAAARLAQHGGLAMVIGSAEHLPLADRSVDIVLVSQLAHHLDDDANIALFIACSRVARRGVVIADLRPTALAALAFRVAAPLFGMHSLTVRDGVTSIARGFTQARLRRLVSAAGHREARIASLPIARIAAAWRT